MFYLLAFTMLCILYDKLLSKLFILICRQRKEIGVYTGHMYSFEDNRVCEKRHVEGGVL